MNARTWATRLVLALAFTMPWEDSLQIAGVGTIARTVGLGVGFLWVLVMLSPGRHRRLDRFHAAMFVYVLWTGLTTYWSYDPAKSFVGLFSNAQLLVFILIAWELLDSRRRIEQALQAYVLGCFVSVGLVLVNFAAGSTTKYLRYAAPGADIDNNALLLAIGLPAALYLALSPQVAHRARRLALVNYVYLPAASFAIVLTATRGAVLASVPTAIYGFWLITKGSPRRKATALAAVIAAAFAVIAFAPAASLQRIESVTVIFSGGNAENNGPDRLNGRLTIWSESFTAFQRRPLIGVGNDAHRSAVDANKVAHNTVISVLVETGLVGLATVLAVVVRLLRLVRAMGGWELRYWVTQLSVIALGAMSLSVEDRKAVWLFVALAAGSGALRLRQRLPMTPRRGGASEVSTSLGSATAGALASSR